MNTDSAYWFFEEVNLYDVFCPHKTKKIDQTHKITNFKKGEYIYFPDAPSTYIYLIASGRVKIGTVNEEGKEIIKVVLSKGEIFGEMVILEGNTGSDFAQAFDNDVMLCPLNVDDMNELMYKNKELSLKLIKLVGLKLKRAERKIESLVFKNARTRIIEFLIDLGTEQGQKVGFELLVKDFFTHQDIASLTATSRQTVTTILNDLRDRNLINFDRKRLLIRDMDMLENEVVSLR